VGPVGVGVGGAAVVMVLRGWRDKGVGWMQWTGDGRMDKEKQRDKWIVTCHGQTVESTLFVGFLWLSALHHTAGGIASGLSLRRGAVLDARQRSGSCGVEVRAAPAAGR
jgi:hypothetical protein